MMFGQVDPAQPQVNPLALALMQGAVPQTPQPGAQGPQPAPQGGAPMSLNMGTTSPPFMQAPGLAAQTPGVGPGGIPGGTPSLGAQGAGPPPGTPFGVPPGVALGGQGMGGGYGPGAQLPPFGFGTMNGYGGGY
jgi:hypothetical protein